MAVKKKPVAPTLAPLLPPLDCDTVYRHPLSETAFKDEATAFKDWSECALLKVLASCTYSRELDESELISNIRDNVELQAALKILMGDVKLK